MFLFRFMAGLSILGVSDKLKQHPDAFKPIFCYPCRREHCSWNISFLSDEETQAKAEDILHFATGAESVPRGNIPWRALVSVF
jgi:hypothetical protein